MDRNDTRHSTAAEERRILIVALLVGVALAGVITIASLMLAGDSSRTRISEQGTASPG